MPEHRQWATETWNVNPLDNPLPIEIRIARDGDTIRLLGAWIRNHVSEITPWEPIIEKMHKYLRNWRKNKLTMKGRKTIVQAIVGGLLQFLTKAQEMPPHIKTTIIKPPSWPLKIITDSRYIIEGLTEHLPAWGNWGWISIENVELFKKAAYLPKKRTAPTTFKWVKGHKGDPGYKESDKVCQRRCK